jgi:predicted CXXCH cytochrome family protein
MDQTCLTCHDKDVKSDDGHVVKGMKATLTQSAFLHGPIRAGSCSNCHDPHGAKHDSLLTKSFPTNFYTPFKLEKYELCFSCHEQQLVLQKETASLTNFRDGTRNLHFLHVNNDEKGRTCKTCHSLHGSNLPNHMATDVPFEGSKWAMPINYEKNDAGGSCSPGCHKPKTYVRGATTQPATQPARDTGVSPVPTTLPSTPTSVSEMTKPEPTTRGAS